jgi:hypothetical protein
MDRCATASVLIRNGMPSASTSPRRIKLSLVLERQRRISVAQAAELRGISEDSFRRHFAHLIEKITPGRDTVRLGDALD